MKYLSTSKKITSVELLGNNLKAIREKKNMSIRDFAKYIKYDRNCLGSGKKIQVEKVPVDFEKKPVPAFNEVDLRMMKNYGNKVLSQMII